MEQDDTTSPSRTPTPDVLVHVPATTSPAPASNVEVVDRSVVAMEKRTKLAAWVIALNLIYYCLPLVVVAGSKAIVLLTDAFGVHSGSASNENALTLVMMILMAATAFFGFIVLSGLAMVIVDIVYLGRSKPAKIAKTLTITSLCLYPISWLIIFSFPLW